MGRCINPFKFLLLSICLLILFSCGSNSQINNSTVTIDLIDNQENIKISFPKETSFIFNIYKFDLESKQWQKHLFTNENLVWDENSYILLYNPKENSSSVFLEIKYKDSDIEKYGYDDYYENVICNEENFTWTFDDNVVLEKNKEIPIIFGIFSNCRNTDNQFNSSLMVDTTKIEYNMIMYTIELKSPL